MSALHRHGCSSEPIATNRNETSESMTKRRSVPDDLVCSATEDQDLSTLCRRVVELHNRGEKHWGMQIGCDRAEEHGGKQGYWAATVMYGGRSGSGLPPFKVLGSGYGVTKDYATAIALSETLSTCKDSVPEDMYATLAELFTMTVLQAQKNIPDEYWTQARKGYFLKQTYKE